MPARKPAKRSASSLGLNSLSYNFFYKNNLLKSTLTKTYTLLIVVLIAVAGQLGINTTSFLTIVGAAGLAIALALKDSLSNFASGVMLIMFRPFRVGDFVVRPWVKTAEYWNVYFALTEKIKIAFDKEGISIPYPQQDVHMFNQPVEEK